MSSQQHNPNLHHDTTVYEIGKGVSWLVAAVFLTMLILPALTEHLLGTRIHQKLHASEAPAKPPLVDLFTGKGSQPLLKHLHTVERNLDKSWYSVALRQGLQEVLTTEVVEGTRKVFLGYNGWMFYQADLRALTGFGPLKPEPFSVMKDPELSKLPETRDVLVNFARQLDERGVKLLLVPLPLKPMIYPEYVSPAIQKEWITHPDAPRYYEELREQGVEVLDLTEPLAKLRSKRRFVYVRDPDRRDKEAVAQAAEDEKKLIESFLKQDTHWTPEAMRAAAEKVAAYIKEKHPEAVVPHYEVIRAENGVYRSSLGDLVKLMDLRDPARLFDEEEAFLRVMAEGTQDKKSPVALLGDSFVNIFDDPTLGFDDPAVEDSSEPRIRAGFAQHLSLLLQQPLDVIAINGGGATSVRREFARRYDDEVRAKKLVVWVIASRDVLLSRTAAHQANIHWAHVEFNPNNNPNAEADTGLLVAPTAGKSLVVEATLTEKSPNQDPNGTPYQNALHAAVYQVDRVVEGTLEAKEITGVQWTFRDKVMQPTASFSEGKRYRLTLVPWETKADLQLLNLEDTTSVFDAPRLFVEKAEEIK